MGFKIFLFGLIGIGLANVGNSTEAPKQFTIEKVSFSGTGCPPESVEYSQNKDNLAFSLFFDQYIAEAGRGIPASQSRKNCQVIVEMNFPRHWSFSVIDIEHRGVAELEKGMSGLHKTSYYFQGESLSAGVERQLGQSHIKSRELSCRGLSKRQRGLDSNVDPNS